MAIPRFKFGIFVILVLGLVFSCKTTKPAPIPGVLLSPSNLSLSTGQEGEITLSLADFDSSIFAISLRIEYDATIVSFSNNSTFLPMGFFGSETINFMDSDSSFVHLSESLTQGQTSKSGSGDVVQLKFLGKVAGSSNIEIMPDYLRLYNSTGNEIIIPDLEIASAVILVQ